VKIGLSGLCRWLVVAAGLTLLVSDAAAVGLGGSQSTNAGTTARSFTPRPTRPSRCFHVSTRPQLVSALAAGYRCVFVENDAEIDLGQVSDNRRDAPDYVLHIPDGVTLASGRSPTVQGGLLYMSRPIKQTVMLDLGAGAHVTGLRLRGYNPFDTEVGARNDGTVGIRVEGVDDVMIDNNEIYDWPEAAVKVENAPNDQASAGRIHITRNFIHNNVECGLGYGVVIGRKGFALIDRNLFNFDRHDVSSDGTVGSGYLAELNFILTSGPTCKDHSYTPRYYNQHFDVHGVGSGGYGGAAGTFFEIRRNTIRGEQSYFVVKTRPALELRGTPEDRLIFAENAVAHDDEGSAIQVKGAGHAVTVGGTQVVIPGRTYLKLINKLVVTDNRYDVDTANELAVGDFNGDGSADVFQSTGASWWYSPGGRREWHFLNDSRLRLNRLAFGDFNGDGKTDVFTQSGCRWLVSYGGTSPWTPLPFSSCIAMAHYRFRDFNGDKKTDIFLTRRGRWSYADGGATPWKPLRTSSLRLDELRFGDFSGAGRTDVFSLADHRWSVSYGGVTRWRRLNERLSLDLRDLVFADFDGDGRTDIARAHNGTWEVSWNGKTPWRLLRRHAPESLSAMLLGSFGGGKRTDALQFRGRLFTPLTRFKRSSGGARPLVDWSLQDMP
jgi:hypothetical protein